jgi:hypothetical protein
MHSSRGRNNEFDSNRILQSAAVRMHKKTTSAGSSLVVCQFTCRTTAPLSLGYAPVVAVISIVEDGVPLPSTDYEVDLDRAFCTAWTPSGVRRAGHPNR